VFTFPLPDFLGRNDLLAFEFREHHHAIKMAEGLPAVGLQKSTVIPGVLASFGCDFTR
jgi:hypothetical protein